MKIKKHTKAAQKKVVYSGASQLQPSRPAAPRSPHGECLPQGDGRGIAGMWQSPGWHASGKNVPHAAQSMFARLINI